MRRFLAVFAALLLLVPGMARAEEASPSPDLGSDDPALKQYVAADEDMGEGKVVLKEGHVDLGPRIIDGQWTFLARDDTAKLGGGKALWRKPEDVVYKVSDKARLTLPEGSDYSFIDALAGEQVWAVPQTEATGVIWLGWNTQAPEVVDTIDRGVTLRFVEAEHIDGDGQLTVFLQPGNFAPPEVLFNGKQSSDVWVDLNTHTHANWVFTKPGTYLLRLLICAASSDKQQHETEAIVRFSVGDQSDPKAAFAAQLPAQKQSISAPEPAPVQASAQSASTTPDKTQSSSIPLLAWIAVGATVVVVTAVIAVVLHGRRQRLESEVFDD